MSTATVKQPKGALASHLKKQNVFFYLSAFCSVAIIALMFLPWMSEPESASLFSLIFEAKRATDLKIFLIPTILGVIVTHVIYLVTMFKPDGEATFLGTVTVLLMGISFFLFLFATDIAYRVVTAGEPTANALTFLGIDKWTVIPLIWLVLTLLQKLWFAPVAHKKEVISYT